MAERACAWCGASLEGRTARAKYCGANCKQNYLRSQWDDRKLSEKTRYNKDYYCANADRLKMAQRKWNAENNDHRQRRDSEYYAKNRSKKIEYQKQYSKEMKEENPKKYREYIASQVERSRARAAERALSILILSQQPET